MFRFDHPYHLPQRIHVMHQQRAFPFRQIDGEEASASRHVRPAIRHQFRLSLVIQTSAGWGDGETPTYPNHRKMLGFVPRPSLQLLKNEEGLG
ncbi:MAG: hypothetical protein ACREU8_09450, partial [Gammaproteobacteria bacterium]